MNDLEVHAYLKAWLLLSGEYEVEGKNGIKIIEPLHVSNVPQSARPYCCYLSTVIFYDDHRNELARIDTHDLCSVVDQLILVDGVWYEMTSSKVEWYQGRWVKLWYGYKNRDKPILLNLAMAHRNIPCTKKTLQYYIEISPELQQIVGQCLESERVDNRSYISIPKSVYEFLEDVQEPQLRVKILNALNEWVQESTDEN